MAALTCGEVAKELAFTHRDGRPNRKVVRDLARAGKIPPPIDMDLAIAHWRWSPAEIDAYIAGQWSPSKAPKVSQ